MREYNAIIASVAGERRLFTDRLRHLDRRVNSGVNKLSWNMDRSALEFYQKEARKFCREGTASVGRFKSGVEAVRAACARIAKLVLVDLERKGVVQVPSLLQWVLSVSRWAESDPPVSLHSSHLLSMHAVL